jgi:exopolysaccharide biosynthesis polyprenyl glycosylphosphotransferase
MLRKKIRLIYLIADTLLINGAAVLAYLIYFGGELRTQNFAAYASLWILITLFRLASLGIFGLYREKQKIGFNIDDFFNTVKATTFSSFAIVTVSLLVNLYHGFEFEFSRPVALYSWLLNIVFLSTGRFIIESLLQKKDPRRVLIVGAGKGGEMVSRHLRNHPHLDYKVIGFLDDDRAKEGLPIDQAKVLGKIAELPRLAEKNQIEEVIIALPSISHGRTLDIVSLCEKTKVRFKIVPDEFEVMAGDARLERVDDLPFIKLLEEPIQGLRAFMKRGTDVLISSLVLLLSLPFTFLITLLIKLDSRGPVLFEQGRVGKDAKIFKIYKFRSMINDAEKHTGPVWAEKNDSRMTRIGRVLRRASLDEIPQFFNVLKGEMSLVGPRPERPYFVKQHQELNGRRLSVRPGVTGLAQINGRYNLSIKEKAKYDLYYIKNQSLSLDLKILLRTLGVVFRQHGVY